MKAASKGMLRTLATRGVVAAIPVAMVSAYASGIFVPPHRNASFDYLPVAEINVSPSTVGVAESPLYGMTTDQINAQLDQLQALGVQNIRVFVPWGLIEQTNDVYDWTNLDRVMQAAAARNMGVMAEINATPTWAGPNPGSPGFPLGSDAPNTAAFTDFLQTFVDKYKTTVSAYEIWNEPNYAQFWNPISPEAYASLLAAAYPIIKNPVNGDPTATVVAGAVGATQDSPFTMNPVTFVQRMLAAGAGAYFDALSVHPYNNDLPFSGDCPTCSDTVLTPREQVDAIKALIGTAKTIWISEYGLPTVAGTDEAKQAQYIMDLINYWQGYSQAGPIFLYTGRDTATGSTDPEANYGLYNQDGTPKDVVAALAAYYLAHPQNPTTPTNPTDPNPPSNPGASIGQFLQQFFQNLGQAIANAFGQNLVNALVSAVTNFFAGLGGLVGGPAPAATTTAAPLTLRVASVQAQEQATPEVESTNVDEASAKTGETPGVEAAAATKTTTPAAAGVAETPAAEPPAATPVTAPVVTAPVITAPVVTAPVITAPVVTAPVVTAPVVTAPVVTAPVVTAPVVTAPVATKPDTTTPPAKTPTATGTDTPGADKSGPDSSAKSGDGDHQRGKGPRSGGPDKTGSDKTESDKTGSDTPHRPKGKGNNEIGATDAKPKAEPAPAGVGVKYTTSTASTG